VLLMSMPGISGQELLASTLLENKQLCFIMITGESGSGKECVGRIICGVYQIKSERCHVISCSAIPESLLESELFGHVKGAFTGADRSREGFFLSADKGTLVLDKIGDISPVIQVKLMWVNTGRNIHFLTFLRHWLTLSQIICEII